MFFGIAWYWWIVIATIVAVSVPFKVKFIKWWEMRRRKERESQNGEWGDEL